MSLISGVRPTALRMLGWKEGVVMGKFRQAISGLLFVAQGRRLVDTSPQSRRDFRLGRKRIAESRGRPSGLRRTSVNQGARSVVATFGEHYTKGEA